LDVDSLWQWFERRLRRRFVARQERSAGRGGRKPNGERVRLLTDRCHNFRSLLLERTAEFGRHPTGTDDQEIQRDPQQLAKDGCLLVRGLSVARFDMAQERFGDAKSLSKLSLG
jgi:hypothetical protein